MASYHCTANIGGAGASANHADYIGRDGKHKKKHDDDLEAAGHGNLPEWAGDSPRSFWQAADEFERVNGSTYRELVVALPRELTPPQRQALVEDFIDRELGGKHAFQWGIHNPKAALEGGEQPHAHVMYSERILDGIDRPREQFFKRYNGKSPEKGGCQKASGGKTKDENVEALVATRALWAEVQNEHLARYAHSARVDHRSLKDQGIDREPERHLGQAQVQTQSPAVERVLAARADRTLAATLQGAIEGAQRRLNRLQALSRALINKLTARPPVAPVASQSDQVDELADFLEQLSTLRRQAIERGKEMEAEHKGEPEREAAKAAHFKREIESMQKPAIWSSKATKQRFDQREADLRRQGRAATDAEFAARKGLALGRDLQAKPNAYVLNKLAREHPGLVERMQPLTRDPGLVELAKQRLAERAKASVLERGVEMRLRDFRSLAAKREMKAHGYGDRGDRGAQWTALPVELQRQVEAFIQTPESQRPEILQRMREDLLREAVQVGRVERPSPIQIHAPRMR
jgi:hypothetical protein